MKTKFLFGSLALAAWLACSGSLSADPLNNWHWRNPLPNGNPQNPPLGAQILNGIIFTNGTFFGVGNDGVVDTSLDATNWTQTISATSNNLNGIICAGGKFVAVGVNGTVETSPDGTNWVLQNSGTTNSLNAITYGEGKFVAVGSATAVSSSDAVTWSPAVSGFPGGGATGVAGNSAGFVAVNGDTNAYFSPDGLNWIYQPLASAPGFSMGWSNKPIQAQIVTSFRGSFLIAACKVVTSGSYEIYMYDSTDGSHWTTNDIGNEVSVFLEFPFHFSFFMGGNSQVIAGGGYTYAFLMFSPDGVTWTQTNTLPSVLNTYNNAGAYGNGSYVEVGPHSPYGIYVSQDAMNWTNLQYTPPPPPPEVGPTSTFNSIAYSNGTYVVATSSSFVVSTNDSVYAVESNTPSLSAVTAYYNGFVGVGSSGQVYQSTNGFAWYQHNSGTAVNLHGVAYGNNLLVAVGDNGTVQTSPTGVIWTSRTSGTSLALYSVAYSNGLYVAVGQQGTVVTSPDGTTWTVQDSTVLNNLVSVTYGSAGFLAVGTNSTMVTSSDGINWTQHIVGNVGPFESVTFGNGYYLVTGTNGLVMTSPDGVSWTSRNVGVRGGQALQGSGFFNGRFDVVGVGGTILESDPVPPLFDLQIKRALPNDIITAFAPPGSSFRILSSSNLFKSSSWSTAATFNNASAITYWTNSPGAYSFYRLVSP